MMSSYAPILHLCTVLCLCLIDTNAQESVLISSVDALTDDINEFTVRCQAENPFDEYEYASFSANKTLLYEGAASFYGSKKFMDLIMDFDLSNVTDSIANLKQRTTEFFELTVKNPRSRLDAMTCHIGSEIFEKVYLPYLRIVNFTAAPLPESQYNVSCQTDANRYESSSYLDKEPFEYRVSLEYRSLILAEFYHLENSANLQNSTLNILLPQYIADGSNVGSNHSFILRERRGLVYSLEDFTCTLSYKNTVARSKTAILIENKDETKNCVTLDTLRYLKNQMNDVKGIVTNTLQYMKDTETTKSI